MEENIKILEEIVEKSKDLREEDFYKLIGIKQIQAIATFIKAYKEKDKDNNDLRRLYRRTSEKLRENGKEELADYFLAQINEVPTFTINDDIDYYTEYYKFINGEIFSVKQLKYIEENQKKYFINKKAVKEKIEWLTVNILDNKYATDNDKDIAEYQIQILQELLEER